MDAPPHSNISSSPSSQDDSHVSSGKHWKEYMGVVALVVSVSALVFVFAFMNPSASPATGLVVGPSLNDEVIQPVEPKAPIEVSQTLSRQTYFKEAFSPNRDSYDLFEQAAEYVNKPVSEMPSFFSLQDEKEIFFTLPAIPSDFGEIAYLLASGRFYAIEGLDESYYKQPEIYPGFKENGLRFWTKPDATSWATNGYGTYPAEQFVDISRSENGSFEATVFIYSSFGVQTFQGMTLFPDSESIKNFDLEISPNTFVLEPNFPKFYSDWARKITIKGTPKPNTPAGSYTVAINVGVPPSDKQKEWSLLYRSLYMDGASGIRPSGNQVTLTINLTE